MATAVGLGPEAVGGGVVLMVALRRIHWPLRLAPLMSVALELALVLSVRRLLGRFAVSAA